MCFSPYEKVCQDKTMSVVLSASEYLFLSDPAQELAAESPPEGGNRPSLFGAVQDGQIADTKVSYRHMNTCSCYSKVDGHVQNSRHSAGFILHISRCHKFGFLLGNVGASPPTGTRGPHSMLLFLFRGGELGGICGMCMRKEKCIQGFGEET